MLRLFFWPAFATQGTLNKDPTVWLDGARPPQKYVCELKIIIQKMGKVRQSEA
jgi:hypothetical protein